MPQKSQTELMLVKIRQTNSIETQETLMIRIAVNGVGRIGRLILREHLLDQYEDIQVIAVNDLTAIDNLAYLLRYDSVHGKPNFPIQHTENTLFLNDETVLVYSESDPSKLPWKALNIDLVIDCTGKFTARADAQKHIDAGARKVLIGAPSQDADFAVVLGVYDDDLDPVVHHIVSNASCTTNSLAPVPIGGEGAQLPHKFRVICKLYKSVAKDGYS